MVVLGLVAGAVALLARANLFPLMSGDSDEPVYVYQARMLAQGHLTLSARVHAQFFHPWLFGQRGSRLFSQYQPAWPAVIALAHGLGDERLALMIAAVAAVVATWFLGQQVAPGSGVFAAVLLLISPFFVVQAALFLPYLWTAALVTGGLGCMIAGVRRPRPTPFLASGALFGVALLTRPLDAAIVAACAGVYALITLLNDRPSLRRAALWTAVGGLPFVLVTAIYNAQVTGSPLRFPLQAADRRDTFGFGNRSLAIGQPVLSYSPQVALTALHQNVRTIPHWFAGSGVGLLLVIAAVVVNRRRLETWLLVIVGALFPMSYFFWWATYLAGSGAAKGLGPHYYIPVFIPLAVLGGWTLRDLSRRSWAIAGLTVAIVAGGSLFMVPTILDNAHLTTNLQRAKASPLTAPNLTNAVVVMRAGHSSYSFLDYAFLVDDPRLNKNNVLYAIDRGPASAHLAQLFPTRKLYQFISQTQPGHPLQRPSFLVEPMQVVTGSTVTLRFRARNTHDEPVVVASVQVNGRNVATQTLRRNSRVGEAAPFEVVLGSSTASLPVSRPGVLVARVGGNGQVRVDVAFGANARRDQADVFERRYFVARTGQELAVQTPGIQYHRFEPGYVVWARQNVGANLEER